jgi:hypothetical protein
MNINNGGIANMGAVDRIEIYVHKVSVLLEWWRIDPSRDGAARIFPMIDRAEAKIRAIMGNPQDSRVILAAMSSGRIDPDVPLYFELSPVVRFMMLLRGELQDSDS